jgi:hypothetical protein
MKFLLLPKSKQQCVLLTGRKSEKSETLSSNTGPQKSICVKQTFCGIKTDKNSLCNGSTVVQFLIPYVKPDCSTVVL